MRGKGVQPRDKRVAVRITPAYAGKRGRTSICLCNIRDHPRVCGEKLSLFRYPLKLVGSPPRMRGKAGSHAHAHNKRGITPAYAGKSRTLGKGGFCRRDHPRVCGEKIGQHIIHSRQQGSPPRMRGKEAGCVLPRSRARITPAYAGKSGGPLDAPSFPRDHPRVCGEKFQNLHHDVDCLGSPPRMRGKD